MYIPGLCVKVRVNLIRVNASHIPPYYDPEFFPHPERVFLNFLVLSAFKFLSKFHVKNI